MTLTKFHSSVPIGTKPPGSHTYSFRVINTSNHYNQSTNSTFTFIPVSALTFNVSGLFVQDLPGLQMSSLQLNINCNVDIADISVTFNGSTIINNDAYNYMATNPISGRVLAAGSYVALSLANFIQIDHSLFHHNHGSYPVSVTVTDVAGNTRTTSATLTIPSATMDGTRPGLAPSLALNTLTTVNALTGIDPDTTYRAFSSFVKLPQTYTATINGDTVGLTSGNYWLLFNEDRFTLEEEGVTFKLKPANLGSTGINDPSFIHNNHGLREPSGISIANFDAVFVSSLMFEIPGAASTPDVHFTYGFFDNLTSIEALSLHYTNFSHVADNANGIRLKLTQRSNITSVTVKNSASQLLTSCAPSTLAPNIVDGIQLALNSEFLVNTRYTNLMDANYLFVTDFTNNVMTYTIETTYSDATTKTYTYKDPLSTWEFGITYPKALLDILAKPSSELTWDYYNLKVAADLTDAQGLSLSTLTDTGHRGNYLVDMGYNYYQNYGITGSPYSTFDVPDDVQIYSYDGHIRQRNSYLNNENLYFNYNPNYAGNGHQINMVIASTIPGRVLLNYRINRYMQGIGENTRFWDVTRRMIVDFSTDPILHHVRSMPSLQFTNAHELYIRCEKASTVSLTDGTSTLSFSSIGMFHGVDSRLDNLIYSWTETGNECIIALRPIYPGSYADGLFLSETTLKTMTVTVTRTSDSATGTQSIDVYPRSTMTYGNDPLELDISYSITATYDAGSHTTTYGVSVSGADASQVSLSQSEIYLYDAGTDLYRASIALATGAGTNVWTVASNIEYNGVLQSEVRAAYTGVHTVWMDLSRTRIKKSDGSFLHIPRISPRSTSSINYINVANYTV